MRKWETFKLGEVVKLKYGKPLIEENRVTGNYPTYSSAGIIGFNNIFFVQNCIIIGRKGNAGSVFLCNQPCFVIDTAFYIDEINENHSLIFLYYLLKTLNLNHFAADAAVPGLNREVAESLNISLPPLAEQERIARILGNYDALIANYEAQIHALQASAQQVYKEWFVRGRCPYGEMETEKVRIATFGKVVTGKTPSTLEEDNFGGGIPFIKTPDMNGTMFILTTNETLTQKGADTQKGTCLPKNSICVSCIGTSGIIAITTNAVSQTNQQINSIILKDMRYLEFLYFAISDLKEIMEMYGNSGATMTNISKSMFENFKIAVPSPAALTAFHTLLSPLFLQIENLQHQISVLKTTRDALLPRLLRA